MFSDHSSFLSEQTFNIVSLVSIVVTLNASPSLFLFEFNPNSNLVTQKKQSVLKEKHCSALRVKERRLLVVSSETDFLARLMLLGRQYSRRAVLMYLLPRDRSNGIKPLCTGPVYPFASLFFQSYKVALPVKTFIANNTIHCFIH